MPDAIVAETGDLHDFLRSRRILACEFADSSIEFEILWWCGSQPMQMRQSRNDVIMAVKSAFDDAGITIPFPQRTLTFDGSLPVEPGDSTRDTAQS